MSECPTKRRWSYSLRTLFVVVTLVAIWLGWSVNWIRQRHEYLEQAYSHGSGVPAPMVLRLLGESGSPVIVPQGDATDAEMDYAAKLFPEAEIYRTTKLLYSPGTFHEADY